MGKQKKLVLPKMSSEAVWLWMRAATRFNFSNGVEISCSLDFGSAWTVFHPKSGWLLAYKDYLDKTFEWLPPKAELPSPEFRSFRTLAEAVKAINSCPLPDDEVLFADPLKNKLGQLSRSFQEQADDPCRPQRSRRR